MLKLYNKLLTILQLSKYNRDMFDKTIITPEEFDRSESGYKNAQERRREEIKRLYTKEGKTQEEIAAKFDISVSMVNLIIKGKR